MIYKIVCNDLSIKECYVGHTTDYIRRKANHKTRCHNEKGKRNNLKVYATIRENGGWICWTMIEIEKYPCNDANESTARERYWFERLNSSLNAIFQQRSSQEYQQDNKEEIAIQKRQYNADHKEEIAMQRRQYNADHKEEIAIQKRQYNEDNKEEMATKRKKTFT
jgi:hypothetical protein